MYTQIHRNGKYIFAKIIRQIRFVPCIREYPYSVNSKYCLSVVFAHSSSFLPLFILFILVPYLCLCVALLSTGFVQSNEWMTLVMSVFGVKTWSFIEVNTLYQVTPLHNVYTTLINVVQR